VLSESSLPTLLWFDCLTLNLSGRYIGQSFTFSASYTPVLLEAIPTPSWQFDLVAWSLSAPALAPIKAVANTLFPFAPLIATSAINAGVDSLVQNAISPYSSFGFGNFATTGAQPLPGGSGWSVSYGLLGLSVDGPELELYLYATVSGPAPSSPPVPDFRLFLSSGVGLTDPSPIGVSLNVSDTSLLDPLLGLRINWRAVRLDTGEEVLNQDTPLTAASATIDIDRWSGDLKFNNTWSVTSEVYRPADALIPRYTYDTETIQVGVDDVVDRHHPFVQWNYEAWFHVRAGHGPLKQHPFWNRNRTSRIHRTDILIRCLMVNRAIPEHDVPPPLEYLDTLEAFGSFDDVESWRHGVLCDYCFFGGPTRTVWKIPTPPTPEWE